MSQGKPIFWLGKIDPTTAAYTAGLIDGEGSIMMSKTHRNNPFRTPVVMVSNNCVELLEWLRETFGGTVITKKKSGAKEWRCKWQVAVAICEICLPHLKIGYKAARARLIVNRYNAVCSVNGYYDDDAKAKRLAFDAEFMAIPR